MWNYENKAYQNGFKIIAGIDEAGRGPLAGPVCAAVVILPFQISIPKLNDSKKLSIKTRDQLYYEIKEKAVDYAFSIVSPEIIDKINILQASLLAMKNALEKLRTKPDYLLIDGIFKIQSRILQEPIIKGDSLSASVAAASIIAKVERDKIMDEYDKIYPNYNFKKHKGYPTKEHKEAIKKFGVLDIHRKTFKGVK